MPDVKRGHKCYKEFVPIVITSHNCYFKGKDTKVNKARVVNQQEG